MAYLPPHLFPLLVGEDALLLALGEVAQEQQRMGRYVVHGEHALLVALHAGDGGEAAAVLVEQLVLLTIADEKILEV